MYLFHQVKNAANQAMGRDGHGLGVNSKFESTKLINIATSRYNITFGSKITQCSGENEKAYISEVLSGTLRVIYSVNHRETNK